MVNQRYFHHPVLGYVVLRAVKDKGLCSVHFQEDKPPGNHARQSADPVLKQVEQRLLHYLNGEPVRFDDIPLHLEGTEFQLQVWHVLQDIPWGETRSYRWVAEQLGSPFASRAVGQANGQNPVAIVIPCHRIVQQNGQTGGYAFGSYKKQFLLNLEKHHQQLQLAFFTKPLPVQANSARSMTLL
ncbi:MAG: methylated-DNA--[protein]-cysteine S-methyltransferase [Cyanobacteria bacterium HKST-UBA06]|nr:methylated-DNA--[protein]-cysteine S-methyltransferase [Cyanobacteria bacterium HKST-UBA06]